MPRTAQEDFQWVAGLESQESPPEALLPRAETRLAQLVERERVIDLASYRKGWVKGMVEVWDEVKDRV